jgi:hypothetical protein
MGVKMGAKICALHDVANRQQFLAVNLLSASDD